MSRLLRLNANLAYDSVFNEFAYVPFELDIATSTPIPYNIPEFLTLKLCNSDDYVYVEGVFSLLAFFDVLFPSGSFSATVKFYRDFNRTDLAYSTTDKFTGLNMPFADTNKSIFFNIPIKFKEIPPLSSTEDTINYYVTIESTWYTSAFNLILISYCFIGKEYSDDNIPNC